MSAVLEHGPLLQRADYTHKYNIKTGRHGWLRLTPAYSVRVVEEVMDLTTGHLRVLDPFCGTATTALSAAYRPRCSDDRHQSLPGLARQGENGPLHLRRHPAHPRSLRKGRSPA